MAEEAAFVAAVDESVGRHEVVGLAVGVVGPEGLRSFHGRGVADIASGRPITEHTVFRIASITKTITAIAVMQLVEGGLVELDAPAGDYLRELRLIPAHRGHRPPTVRQLLTHTGGIGELAHLSGLVRPDFGESVPAGDPMPSLAEFYGGAIRLRSEPGTSFTYGNQSPAVLGQLVEDVSGIPLGAYFRERIFEPLGMQDSDLSRSSRVRSALATGYDVGSHGPVAVEERDMVTAGAASVYSTTADMARYVAALLGGGSNEHGTILGPESLAQMFRPQYQPDPRIPGMGLGFFRADLRGHPLVEHQGVHPGFHSHLCLAPDDGAGVVVFTNGARDPMFWLSTAADELLGVAIGVPPESGSQDPRPRRETPHGIIGWYRLAGPWSDLRKRVFMGAGAEVSVRDGRLRLRFLTPVPDLFGGFELHPDDAADADVFRIDLDEAGTSRVVFGRGADGAITSMTLGMMPITLRKQPRWTNPRLWFAAVSGIAAAATAAAVAALVRLRRR